MEKIKGRLGRLRKALHTIISSFSPLEMRVFVVIVAIAIVSCIGLLFRLNNFFLIEVPAYGGTLREGIVGAPRFINPLLALGDADRDLTALVYSGLMRGTLEGGLIPDLAESYSVSNDGLVYTFVLKEGLIWHDGKPIGSDDVVFTVTKAKDPSLRSPKRASWEGVTVEKKDDRTVVFTLQQPYSPFLENMTLGIMPEHLWKDVSSEQFGFSKFNVEPVGGGPYKIKTIKKDSSGIPVRYDLSPFKQSSLGRAYINTIEIFFFSNEEDLLNALGRGTIESAGALPPQKALDFEAQGFTVKTFALPRIFGIFFNQNQNEIFTDRNLRVALNTAIDRDGIVKEILHGYGTPLLGPLPPGGLGYLEASHQKIEKGARDEDANRQEAIQVLEEGGWKMNEKTKVREKRVGKKTMALAFSLITSDTGELAKAASLVKESWEKLGARVNLKTFNTNDLNQNIIRPRKYDALFFGEIIGREGDPFAFWHSSQRNDPGLNVALYANITVDKLLERGRTVQNNNDRIEIYEKFQAEIAKDIPAIFIYSPDFLYVLPPKVQGAKTGTITTPSERFLDVSHWFIETNKVWRFFVK